MPSLSPFYHGVIVGLFLGAIVGVYVVAGLCIMAQWGDHRGGPLDG